MSALWSAQQREWLQAMGLQVWSLGPADALAEPASAAPAHAMREAAALLSGDERRRPAPAARTAPPADRLLLALIRAAGGQVDEAALATLVPDVSALRGNASAKRALWPRLRALRAGKRPT